MIAYTICFIRRGSQILMLNRERASWMGCWNGIGGKLEPGETPRASMLRELREETGMKTDALRFKGLVTWRIDGAKYGGMYAYMAEADESRAYDTPVKTEEGILDWKETAWLLDPANMGIAANVKACLASILDDPACYDHRCIYEQGKLQAHHAVPIDASLEVDEPARSSYLAQALRSYPNLAEPSVQGASSP
ncbi:8-oxo-dGTP diphosphatase [Paenibacillus lycopersici]|uniref:8-oxo-dGTP diphosphatase n=1 Tax=Paenibacillus lycopersici TaxID=2704462 RepID=A0A6C0FXM4_9BACL|nr:8-oxo-dGTP diphosphatase [Paenibacillus lycopersici]QHT60802.1 8-oxo-dGTP diphosphatase [Paenibacillus lycopersici]